MVGRKSEGGSTYEMIDVCFDILRNNLDLTNMREMYEEMKDNPNLFIKLLMDNLEAEIEEREENLLSQGLCPKCKNEVEHAYAYEWHEVWGHMQLCRVPSDAVCIYCGWKED